jgi:hypothetical protein
MPAKVRLPADAFLRSLRSSEGNFYRYLQAAIIMLLPHFWWTSLTDPLMLHLPILLFKHHIIETNENLHAKLTLITLI